MRIFDFNIHLPYITDADVNVVINQDLSLTSSELSTGLSYHRKDLSVVDGANFLLFNSNLLSESIVSFKQELNTVCPFFYLTALLDFRRTDCKEYIFKAKEEGIHAIMFNSYLQKISDSDFVAVIAACKIAESLGMIICIDGSYGTSKMFEYNNCKLACAVSDHISIAPIVIVHSGGYNIIRIMNLALDKKNVWLDTSFSLPFYIGSSLEVDFAFAYRKLNFERVVFGSDNPYMNIHSAIETHKYFFEKYKFPSSAVENIFFHNGINLLNNSAL